jgi:hypothetical protein
MRFHPLRSERLAVTPSDVSGRDPRHLSAPARNLQIPADVVPRLERYVTRGELSLRLDGGGRARWLQAQGRSRRHLPRSREREHRGGLQGGRARTFHGAASWGSVDFRIAAAEERPDPVLGKLPRPSGVIVQFESIPDRDEGVDYVNGANSVLPVFPFVHRLEKPPMLVLMPGHEDSPVVVHCSNGYTATTGRLREEPSRADPGARYRPYGVRRSRHERRARAERVVRLSGTRAIGPSTTRSTPQCLTVWVIDGEGCAVSEDGTAPLQCVSAPDPWVLNPVPDRFGTCIIGIDDCAARSCSPSQESAR